MFELQKTYIPSMKISTKTMAMPLRLVTSLLIIFFVISVWLLNAHHSHHAGGNILADEYKPFLTQEGLGRNVVAAPAAKDNRIKARKMVIEKVVKKEKMMMLEKRNIALAAAAAASEKSGSISKMSTTREKFVKKEMDFSSEGQKRSLLSEEINVGFVAFNEDYHGPRHHPPKNN